MKLSSFPVLFALLTAHVCADHSINQRASRRTKGGDGGGDGGGNEIKPVFFVGAGVFPLVATAAIDDDDGASTTTVEANLEIGSFSYTANPVCTVSTETSILLDFGANEYFDDDKSAGGVGQITLEIMAYPDCTAAPCSSTPFSMGPGPVTINGISDEYELGDNDESIIVTGIAAANTDIFYHLTDTPGTFFLYAKYTLDATAAFEDYADEPIVSPPSQGVRRMLETSYGYKTEETTFHRNLQNAQVDITVDNFRVYCLPDTEA
jgi:hypothetical protein